MQEENAEAWATPEAQAQKWAVMRFGRSWQTLRVTPGVKAGLA